MTNIKRYRDAYASMIVAVYEPLILKWVAETTVAVVAAEAARYAGTSSLLPGGGNSPASASVQTLIASGAPGFAEAVPASGGPTTAQATYDIEATAEAGGFELLDERAFAERTPIVSGPGVATRLLAKNPGDVAKKLAKDLNKVFLALDTIPGSEARDLLVTEQGKYFAKEIAHKIVYWPAPTMVMEMLSPLGIAHFYRQHYFNLDEGVGPIEEAFTIAPLETLEVLYETTRRQIHEELLETGVETVSESATEQHNLEELSDKVSSMVQRDSSAAMSASASYSAPMWQVSVSGSVSLSESSQRGREEASRRLKEFTKRASERITKTFTLRARTVDELTTNATTRRVIRNDAAHPVNYGLRRVLRRVRVKVQDLGPRLVWQLYVKNPGDGLARSRFVHFAPAQTITTPNIPPGMSPRPVGGTETGSAVCALNFRLQGTQSVATNKPEEPSDYKGQPFIKLAIAVPPDRSLSAVVIDSMTDVGDPNPENDQGEPAPTRYHTLKHDPTTKLTEIEIDIRAADSMSVNVNYTYLWEPSQGALEEWEKQRQAAVKALEEFTKKDEFAKAFEREKAQITELSRINPRPAVDLRREERYEVMHRLVARVFSTVSKPADPTPLEIETFQRLFDVEAIFSYTHPSWWRPRYIRDGPLLPLQPYEITAEADPAPMGRSLGWIMQLDGDQRRNEFLNSPWARVCVPIRPSREAEAVDWLAAYVEGKTGFDFKSTTSPLKNLVDEITTFRKNERALGVDGPDYVEVDSVVAGSTQGPLKPESIYPVVDEFDVTVPTDGFVYDELKIIEPTP